MDIGRWQADGGTGRSDAAQDAVMNLNRTKVTEQQRNL
jgi:hypothetical protein